MAWEDMRRPAKTSNYGVGRRMAWDGEIEDEAYECPAIEVEAYE